MQKNTSPNTATPRSQDLRVKHLRITEPSPWVARFAPLVKAGGSVLDLAAGGGRHGRHFLGLACEVVFIDRNTQALEDLNTNPSATIITADLEDGTDPFGPGGALDGQVFDAVVVVNYLYRPLMLGLRRALVPGGMLIYETFARGNEDFARPRNPDHLLKNGELLDLISDEMQVVAYEHGRLEETDIPGVKQRLCAIKDLHESTRDDGEPPVHRLIP